MSLASGGGGGAEAQAVPSLRWAHMPFCWYFTKNNMASKIVKKNILDPYDENDSILFDISKCRWLLGGGGGEPRPPFENCEYHSM